MWKTKCDNCKRETPAKHDSRPESRCQCGGTAILYWVPPQGSPRISKAIEG